MIKKFTIIIILRKLIRIFSDSSSIARYANDFKKFLLLYIVAGILSSVVILLVFFQFYQLLVMNGFSSFEANNIILIFIFFIVGIAYLAKEYSSKKKQSSLKKITNSKDQIVDNLNQIFKSFVEGFVEEKELSKYKSSKNQPTNQTNLKK